MEISTTKVIVIAFAVGLVATSLAVAHIGLAFADHKPGHANVRGCTEHVPPTCGIDPDLVNLILVKST
jgi:hypothetical protein